MRNRSYVFLSMGAVLIATLAGCGCQQKKEKEEIVVTEEKQASVERMPYEKPANASPITGLACDNYNKRTYAVMYSGDVETRPYFSNITRADMVVEMAHRATHGGTRVMGIFGCHVPDQIGPMRSGRPDFANFADATKSVFVSWGGDATVKSMMNRKLFDNMSCADGGVNAGSKACYRIGRDVIPLDKEDRAFTSMPELIASGNQYGYSAENTFTGFPHAGEALKEQRPAYGRITVGFDGSFRVHYEYNPETNSYDRLFNDHEEYDFVTKDRVSPKNVVVMHAKKDAFYTDHDYRAEGLVDPWETISAQEVKNDNAAYPNWQIGDPWFDTVFEGPVTIFMNGQEIKGMWKKDRASGAPFRFYDTGGKEIAFVPGQIWVEVIMDGKTVKWKEGTDEDRAAHKAKREEPQK